MSEQYIRDRDGYSQVTEKNDQDMNVPVVDSDLYVDKTPVETVLVTEGLASETLVAFPPADEMTVKIDPEKQAMPLETPVSANVGGVAALLDREVSEHFRTRWNEVQGKFVDEPRSAVQQADGLVSEVVEQITRMFSTEHSLLESQWNEGKDVSTEDLRKALQRYRTFFNRLVA